MPDDALKTNPQKLISLKKRAQFLRVAKGKRRGAKSFLLQMQRAKQISEQNHVAIGFTVTKRVGNSPERNRIKRRLREAAKKCQADFMLNYDYVIIGKRAALYEPFDELTNNIKTAIKKINNIKKLG